MQKINDFLKSIDHELSITVFMITMAWTMGLVVPVAALTGLS